MKINKLLICFAFIFLLIGTVSAFDFDNVYNYNKGTDEVTIKNAFGLGADIAYLDLVWGDTEVGIGKDTHVGTFGITFVKDASDEVFNEMGLINLRNGNTMTKGKQYKAKTIKQEDNYVEKCGTQINGSYGCQLIEDGKKDVIEWIPIVNPNFEFINGQYYEIGIFVDTVAGDYGDWIPDLLGVQIDEWASYLVLDVISTGYAGNGVGAESGGIRFQAKQNLTYIKAVVEGTATKLKLYTVGKSLLNTSTLVSGNATIVYDIVAMTEYILTADNDGGSYTYYLGDEGLPKNGTLFNFLHPTFNLNDYVSQPSYGFNILAMEGLYDDGLTSPVITLNQPANNWVQTNSTIEYYFDVTDDKNVKNITLYRNGSSIYVNTSEVNGSYFYSEILADGSYSWFVQGIDNESSQTNSSTRTFSIDTVSPVINITSPDNIIDGYTEAGRIVNFNWTATDTNLDDCWYQYNGTNNTVTCADNGTTIVITDKNYNNITFYANDTAGITSTQSETWNFKLYENSFIYDAAISSGQSTTFNVNLSSDGSQTITAELFYNATSYPSTKSGNNAEMTFSKTLAPITTGKNTFYWNVSYGGTYYSSSSYNQTVSDLNITNCSGGDYLFNLTLVNEETQALITAPANITIDVDITVKTSAGVSIDNFTQAYTEQNPILICINKSLLTSTPLLMDAQFNYNANLVVPEFYNIQSYSLTNTTLYQNITLYDLLNADSQEFKITYKDSNFLPVEDALIQVQRKYIAEGVFKTVEIPKTDSLGQTIGHFVVSDVIYNIIVVKDGVILSTFNNVVAICDNLATGDCNINLNAASSHVPTEAYDTAEGLSFTQSYDNSARTLSVAFTVVDGSTQTVTLNATKYDAFFNQSLCTDTLTSSSGTLSCYINPLFENVTAVFQLQKDSTVVSRSIIKIADSPDRLYGASKGALMLLMFLTIIGLGISGNPVVTSVFLLVGLIIGAGLNLMGNAGFVGVASTFVYLALALGVIVYKLSRREA